jgi:two-component sensor histidine kinase
MYHQRALRLRETIRYSKGIADSYQNIGDVYLAWKQYAKAEVYLLEALRQKKQLDNQSNMINTLASLGKLYVAVGDSKTAYTCLVRAYEAARTIGNSPKLAESMCYLGTYYGSVGERAKAVGLFHRTQAIARASSDWPLMRDALQGEITLMEKTMSASEVVQKYHELLETKEKVQRDLNSKELARLEIAYDVERKNDELKLRRKQARIDHLQKQRLAGWLAAVGGIAVFAWIAFYEIRRRKKQIETQKDQIVHLHNELSHRTKNYFSLLSGILSSERKKARNEEVVRMLDVNIHRLDAMSLVQGYLLSSSAQSGNKVQLDAYLDHLISELLLNLFPGENILEVNRNLETIFLDYDKAMRVAIVLNELICNSIEHGLTGLEHPVLAISLKRRNHELVLTVRDNGPGIPAELLQPNAIKGRDLIAKLLHTIDGTIFYRNENGCVAEVVVTL